MENQTERANQRNEQMRTKLEHSLNTIDVAIDMLNIGPSHKQHLFNNANELRALIKLYVAKQ